MRVKVHPVPCGVKEQSPSQIAKNARSRGKYWRRCTCRIAANIQPGLLLKPEVIAVRGIREKDRALSLGIFLGVPLSFNLPAHAAFVKCRKRRPSRAKALENCAMPMRV